MPSVASVLHRVKRATVPLSKQMAANALIARLIGYAEPEIRALPHLVSGRRTAVDIGANSGDYTFALAGLFKSVVAFEPNPGIARPIAAARLPNVRLETVALSCQEGHAVLAIPVVNGQELDGWATLGKATLAGQPIEIDVRTRPLDAYRLTDVDFMKIDVEGHELRVHQGAFRTITNCRPTCLIEAAAGDTTDLVRFFQPFDYAIHRAWKGIVLSPQNVLLIPN
jgi:FkbM family methyltransferase